MRFHSLSKPRAALRVAESMELQRRSRPSSVAALAVAAMIVGAVLAVSQSHQSTVKSVKGHSLLSRTSRSTESKWSPGPPGGSTQRLTRCTPHSASPARRASPHANARGPHALYADGATRAHPVLLRMRPSAGDVLTVTMMQRFVTKLSKDDAEAAAETQLKQPKPKPVPKKQSAKSGAQRQKEFRERGKIRKQKAAAAAAAAPASAAAAAPPAAAPSPVRAANAPDLKAFFQRRAAPAAEASTFQHHRKTRLTAGAARHTSIHVTTASLPGYTTTRRRTPRRQPACLLVRS